ncbi:hypothetical protein, partial [Desulfobacterium sp. N47]
MIQEVFFVLFPYRYLIGSSLKSMGNPIQDMIDISHQEIEEVETNYYERYGTISVGIGFDITM